MTRDAGSAQCVNTADPCNTAHLGTKASKATVRGIATRRGLRNSAEAEARIARAGGDLTDARLDAAAEHVRRTAALARTPADRDDVEELENARLDLTDAVRRQEIEARRKAVSEAAAAQAAAAAAKAAAKAAPVEAPFAPVEAPAAPVVVEAPVAAPVAAPVVVEQPAPPAPVAKPVEAPPAAPAPAPAPAAPALAPAAPAPAAPLPPVARPDDSPAPPPAAPPAQAAAPVAKSAPAAVQKAPAAPQAAQPAAPQGTRSTQLAPAYPISEPRRAGRATSAATSAAGREVEAASRAAGLDRLRERADATLAARIAPKPGRKPQARPDAVATAQARAATETRIARTGNPEIGTPLSKLRAAATEMQRAAAVLADISPDTGIRMLALRGAAAHSKVRAREEEKITREYHARLAASPQGAATLDRLHAGLGAVAKHADELSAASAAHGGLTARQNGALHRIRNGTEEATRWLPLAPGWEKLQGRPGGGYVGLDAGAILDPYRFTKRDAKGGTYVYPPLPADHAERTSAEMEQRQRQDFWNASAERYQAEKEAARQARAAAARRPGMGRECGGVSFGAITKHYRARGPIRLARGRRPA